MSEAYWAQVQALREERAHIEAERAEERLDDLADLINTGSWEFADGSRPSRRDLGMIRSATRAGLYAAQDAGWRLLPPEGEVDR